MVGLYVTILHRNCILLLRHYPPPPHIVLAHVTVIIVFGSITYYCTCLRHYLLSRHNVLGLSSDVRAGLMSHCAGGDRRGPPWPAAKLALYDVKASEVHGRHQKFSREGHNFQPKNFCSLFAQKV